MTAIRLRLPALLSLVALLLAACSSTAPTVAPPAATSEPTPPTSSLDPDRAAELEALYYQRQAEARTLFTKADVDFMTGMIGHHAQALVMSALAPKNGASPTIQRLAARIINAQNDEIAIMQQWLRDREQPVPQVHIEGNHLMVHGAGMHHDHTTMPGMLSDEQIQELVDARNTEFDRLFLTYMIQHHDGAVIMVDELFNTDGAVQDEEAFKLASAISVDQITEIEFMKLMLEDLPAEDR